MWDKANLMLVGGADTPWHWGHWGHSGWGWVMDLHGLTWVLFLVLVVLAVVLLVRAALRGNPPAQVAEPGGASAVAVLDARYARGEIDRGDYLERQRGLS